MNDSSALPHIPPQIPRETESSLDSESAALLRAALQPVFEQAATWEDLLSVLRGKGYGLVFRGERLVLVSADGGQRLCTTRFLGRPLADLVTRLGRPAVRAVPGRLGAGEFSS